MFLGRFIKLRFELGRIKLKIIYLYVLWIYNSVIFILDVVLGIEDVRVNFNFFVLRSF